MSGHDGMPPPPPRVPGAAGELRRRAMAAAAAAVAGHGQTPEESPPRDPCLPLPLPWESYFDRRDQLACSDRRAVFNVYTAGSSGPVVLCLHGGGYTGLSWALIARALKDRCRVVAPDLRCHGLTQAADESDLSAATLAADVAAIWTAMYGCGSAGGGTAGGAAGSSAQQGQQAQQADVGPPPTVLVGHSMGGAVAVHAAALAGISSLAGIVVIDVVEGTALASLPYMAGVLQRRPQRFATLRHAVDWALDTGMCNRQEAAHLSLPSMLRQEAAGAGGGASGGTTAPGSASTHKLTAGGLETLAEEEGEEGEEGEQGGAQDQAAADQAAVEAQPAGDGSSGHAAAPAAPASGAGGAVQAAAPAGEAARGASGGGGGWVWRTPLEQSSPFWEGWYTGLSDLFLSLPVPKVLVLVGTDRLDRSLTIGQMQGKFQPVLLPQAGHAVHEDEPERTADAIANFMRRFRIGEPPLTIPRPAAGMKPVLPVAMGPAFGQQQGPQQQQ